MDMAKVDDWLSGIPGKSTRKSYLSGVRLFEQFYGKPIEKILDESEKEAGRTVEKFFVWLKEKKYSQNSARNLTNAVIQFSKFFDLTPKYRKSIGIYTTVIATNEYPLNVTELQSMASVADLKEQIILEVFMLGLRVNDAAQLKWQLFDVGVTKAPIQIDIMTEKEMQPAKSFISVEFQELLAKYLPTLKKENPYLLQSARKGHLDDESLNWTLKRLGERAGINLRGMKLHWHIGRKMYLKIASSLGVNEWNCRMLVGKSVSADILTYLDGVALQNDFIKVSNVLRLKPINGTRIGNVEQTVQLLEKAFGKFLREFMLSDIPGIQGLNGVLKEKTKKDLASIPDEELLKAFLES